MRDEQRCDVCNFFYIQNLQQELSVREPTVTAMRQPGNLPPIQHDELSHLWDRVAYLCEIRENQLMDALKLVFSAMLFPWHYFVFSVYLSLIFAVVSDVWSSYHPLVALLRLFVRFCFPITLVVSIAAFTSV